jgi:ABC-type Fe3+ transport system permease subunit
MYKTTLGAFEQIDVNLLSVARTLGASEWNLFRRIMMPLAIPGILAGMTLAFARALGEFGATLMLAGNIPGQTQTIPMAIYFAVEAGAMDEAWFWAILIMVISLSGIVTVNFWQNNRGTLNLSNQEWQGVSETLFQPATYRSSLTIASIPTDHSPTIAQPSLWSRSKNNFQAFSSMSRSMRMSIL